MSIAIRKATMLLTCPISNTPTAMPNVFGKNDDKYVLRERRTYKCQNCYEFIEFSLNCVVV